MLNKIGKLKLTRIFGWYRNGLYINIFECDKCRRRFFIDEDNLSLWNYCPHCGQGMYRKTYSED